MMAFLKLFNVVPGFVYALIIAALLLMTGVTLTRAKVQVAEAQSQAASAKTTLAEEREYAARKLAEQTDKLRIAESDLRDAYDVQEGKDRTHEKVVADLKAKFRSSAGNPTRLRDNFAAACPDPGTTQAPASPAAAKPGGEDPPETGRVLSDRLTEFLFEQAGIADEVNIAYASCREDSISLRAKLKQLNEGLNR